MMRSTVLAVALLFAVASGAHAQQETAHERAAAELIDLLQLEQLHESSIEMLMETMLEQNPMLTPFRDIFADFFAEFSPWQAMYPQYLNMYRDAYTEPELRELIAFYRTPVGQKTVELMPELMQQGAEIGHRQIEPHLPELERRIEARVRGEAGGP